jgi:hypothetical protein
MCAMGRHRNIERAVYSPRSRGYLVYMTRAGKKHLVYVSDNQAGGRAAALREALRIRRQLEAKLPPLLWHRLHTNNETGVPAVTRVEGLTRAGKRATPRYQAFWIDGAGRRRTRSYSVSVYEERQAFQLAVEARRRGVREAIRAAVARVGHGRVPAEVPGLESRRHRRTARRRRV